jgi:hypothetical protein
VVLHCTVVRSSKGSVTAQELKLVLERFGSDVTMSEAKEIIAVVDTGKTGKLGTCNSRLTRSFVNLDDIRVNCAQPRLNYARELTRNRRTIRVGRPAQLDTIALKWPRRHQLSDAPRLGWPRVMKRSVECGAGVCGVCVLANGGRGSASKEIKCLKFTAPLIVPDRPIQ